MSDSTKPSERLCEIEKSNDGFYLAEVDLRLRGPGEIYGMSVHLRGIESPDCYTSRYETDTTLKMQQRHSLNQVKIWYNINN